jgi:hypothetical protein
MNVDREKTCPFLLRCYFSLNRTNNANAYKLAQRPGNEVQLYTWKNATFNEIISLLQEAIPDAKKKNNSYKFSIVYPDRTGTNVVKLVCVPKYISFTFLIFSYNILIYILIYFRLQ